MKKYIILIIAFLFSALCLNVFGQTKQFPFEVLKTGSGDQSIIFIPGFASSGDVWNETRATFENEFTCYTLTMAGFAGRKPQPNASFENWKTGIANYIKDNQIEEPILIGHSMGGALALALAADYPDLISKIVVVDAVPCLAAINDPAFKSKINNDCSTTLNQMTGMTNDQFYDMQKKTMPSLLADTTKLDMVVDWSVKSDRTTFGQMYCDFFNIDLRERIAQIKCPALILLESYFINLKPAIEGQYRSLKTANFQYATTGLHFIMYDDTAWYLGQLSTFLKQ